MHAHVALFPLLSHLLHPAYTPTYTVSPNTNMYYCGGVSIGYELDHTNWGDAFTARTDYYLLIGEIIDIEEFGVAHVWFQCYEKGYFENARNTYF